MATDREQKYQNGIEEDLRSPRISWSVLTMGAGVIASIVLNYAAYDTRITVLERTKLNDEKIIVQLEKELLTLRVDLTTLTIQATTLKGNAKYNQDKIITNADDIENIEEDIDEIKDKINKAP